MSNEKTKKLLKNTKYTIATITSERHGNTTYKSTGSDYEYKINEKTYIRQTSMYVTKHDVYLTIYDSLDPNNSRVLKIYLINNPNDIVLPANGWKYEEVPIKIDSVEIRRYVEKWR